MKFAIATAALVAGFALSACNQESKPVVTTTESGRTVTSREDNPDVINYGDNDAAMNAAIADAQTHLPYFWERAGAPTPSEENFMLKVAFPTPIKGGREHIWVYDFQKTPAGYAGLLANEPLDIAGKLGDRVEFTPDMITDWGFLRDSKMIGYYTTRVSLADGDPAEVAAIRAMLCENPK